MRRAALLAAATALPRWLPVPAVAGLLALAGCGSESGTLVRPATAPPPAPTTPVVPPPAPPGPGPGPFGARLLRPTNLRDRPRGHTIVPLRTHTEFGSLQIMAVARRLPGWLGVRTPQLANGKIGWIRARDAELLRETYSLDVDLSARRLLVRHLGKKAFAIPVAIGAGGTPTPTGRFGVTDRLRMTPGTPYGCCALALTGHQPLIPQGWGGGDRIAIHGTTNEASVGSPASHGCLRATAAGMRRLMAVIPLGTPVHIHR